VSEEEDDGFDEWLARLTERRARRAAVEASVEARRAELKAQRMARLEAERGAAPANDGVLIEEIGEANREFDLMRSTGKVIPLCGPRIGSVMS
jgi:hypothetical protein